MKNLSAALFLCIACAVNAQYERHYAPVNPLAGTFATQWLTYAGATDTDELLGVRDMPDGGVVVCGRTMSAAFPGTDSLDTLAGSYDMVIFRMDSFGQILWTTIYGGLFYESANALVVHDTSIYVVGSTNGNDCPMVNAFQPVQAGSYDAVILRLGFDGTVQQSSYYGGMGAEQAYGIDIDSSGRIVIGGASTSATIPLSAAGYQQSNAGANDCFIAVLDTAFAPVWATFYGGTSTEDVHTLQITPLNQIVVCGGSFSTNFPCTPGAFQNGRLGICDAYYIVFGMDGSRKYATYYGGSGNEDCFGIAGDADGNIYLAGHTSSIDFNTAGTTFQPMFQGVNDAWVARFDSTGAPYFSTFFGGAGDDKTWSMVRRDAYLYIVGVTASTDLPMNVTAPQDSLWGGTDAFVLKFDTAGNYITSSFLGGSGADDLMSITVNSDTVATCVGYTYSNDLAVVNPYQANYVGSGDGLAVRYKLSEVWSSSGTDALPGETNSVSVFPNPASGNFTLQSDEQLQQVELLTIEGKSVPAEIELRGTAAFVRTGGLAPGIYMVRYSGAQRSGSVRLVIAG
jgi:hypothetical protein